MRKVRWHFRNNKKRKMGNTKKGKHPVLVVGETDDKKAFINLGLTKSKKRGRHNNIKIHNPQDWGKTSYIRDDIRVDPKKYLSDVLKDYKLCPEDINKILVIINKKNPH